jgi:hypothetical protein
MFTFQEVLTDHHDDFVRTLWALSKLKSCLADSDAIETKLTVNTAFNQMAQLVRLADGAIPGMAERTKAIRAEIYAEGI